MSPPQPRIPTDVLRRFSARLAAEDARNADRAAEMRAILLTALVGPLNEAQDARLGEILRGTRPRAVEPGEFPYELFSDQKTKGRLKSLVEAEVATDFPSLHTLLLCLGDWIFDSR